MWAGKSGLQAFLKWKSKASWTLSAHFWILIRPIITMIIAITNKGFVNTLLPCFLTGPHIILFAHPITDVTNFIGPVDASEHSVMLAPANVMVALTWRVAGASCCAHTAAILVYPECFVLAK
jgi:hypothetical protein